MIAKLRFLFWLGIILLFIPYIGVRSGVRTVVTILIGAVVIYLSFRLRRAYKELRFQMRRLEHPASVTELTTDSSNI